MVIIIRKHLEVYAECRDDPKDPVTDYESFRFKSRFLSNANYAGAINIEIEVPLKYLSSFRRTTEMPLINCEINLILSWLPNCVITKENQVTTFDNAHQTRHTRFFLPEVEIKDYNRWKI